MTLLTPALRASVNKLIEERANNVIETLEEQIEGRPTEIRARLLREQGIEEDTYALNEQLMDLNSQVRDFESEVEDDAEIEALEEELESIDRMIAVEIEAARSQKSQAIARINSEFQETERRINASKTERAREITARKESREAVIMEREAPGVIAARDQVKKQLEAVRRAEKELAGQVSREADLINRSRGRLVRLVSDAAARAKQKLLLETTTEGAHGLLADIPSSAEVIFIAEDPAQGLANLVSRLGADKPLQIAPPAERPAPTETQEEDEDDDDIIENDVEDTPVSIGTRRFVSAETD